MSEYKECGICGSKYMPMNYCSHIRTFRHIRALERHNEHKELERKQKQAEHELDIEIASALEGYTLCPGDEITTRNNRAFKVDIHGKLFEVPLGSVG